MSFYHAYTVYLDILDDDKDEEQSPAILDRIIEAGIRALNLTDVYEIGESERHDKMEDW